MTILPTPTEDSLVEQPILQILAGYGYDIVPSSAHKTLRARENEVLFRSHLVSALMRLNGISKAAAEAIYNDLANLTDNETWVKYLRGGMSRQLPGEDKHKPIRLVDFDNPHNNTLVATNQLRIKGFTPRRPDVIVYINGIPVVVIEAKSPLAPSQDSWAAIDQIKIYESDIPRLFHSNLFNIATNDLAFLYGATGAPREWWFFWRDPWPRQAEEFADETEKGLYALLEPSRLLDILAHFIVFERDKDSDAIIKKICRYQQFRAVNKMVNRVVDGDHQQGLIWHTQGSGKSLTMVFAALKLKFHQGIHSERLRNPNVMVITDRKDLDAQITQTFVACGLPNPIHVDHIKRPKPKKPKKTSASRKPKRAKKGKSKVYLDEVLASTAVGRMVLATVFKFNKEEPRLKSKDQREREQAIRELAIPNSGQWILMVDECHRSQEEDLGAYLRAMLPDSFRFGFTGTPVKKGDKNTFQNFGVPGEKYLDKYGIDDAVKDGATVPIYYQARMTEWHLHDKKLDVMFEQWFANEPEERVEELKRRGVTQGDLARFWQRIDLIGADIWSHYRKHVLPDGFKAQVVAIDRLACVAYKKALDEAIARTLTRVLRLPKADARKMAGAMSVCIYSPGQHDKKRHPELVKYQVDEAGEKDAIARFQKKALPLDALRDLDPNEPDEYKSIPLYFIIVCNKLLTGFDAPVEQSQYLDNPLTNHSLLQAIARTNRRYGTLKQNGLIVDYIGVSTKLSEALAAYNKEDIEGAMVDADALYDQLNEARRQVFLMLEDFTRTNDVKADVKAVIAHLGTEDVWYEFQGRVNRFIRAYGTLSPDPRTLAYKTDLEFLSAVLPYGRLKYEQEEPVDWKAYSEKIREMLDEHLEVTGLKTMCKMRSLSDPEFWKDFDDPDDLETAAVRKLAEIKREVTERVAENEAQYGKFSERVKELLKEFNAGHLGAEEALQAVHQNALELVEEGKAHVSSGLSRLAYGVWQILLQFEDVREGEDSGGGTGGDGNEAEGLTPLQQAAAEIDELYRSDQTAPLHWQSKAQLRKDLRRAVRRIVMGFELKDWKRKLPAQVDEFAIKHYAKP